MLSPLMTVLVLVVLWLIVVVPMVLRRSDEVRRERSVDGFGKAMRALGRRPEATEDSRPEVFVARQKAAPRQAPLAAPARRPVPAAKEALMYPPDEDEELSEARAQMLGRRRRSLGVLGGGSALFVVLGLVMGGIMWALAGVFLIGFAGYLWFLRSQALRDRARRENRQIRAEARQPAGYDATDDDGLRYVDIVPASTVVRIDDDDIELQSMDTIDLTGLYSEEREPEPMQRRAS